MTDFKICLDMHHHLLLRLGRERHHLLRWLVLQFRGENLDKHLKIMQFSMLIFVSLSF